MGMRYRSRAKPDRKIIAAAAFQPGTPCASAAASQPGTLSRVWVASRDAARLRLDLGRSGDGCQDICHIQVPAAPPGAPSLFRVITDKNIYYCQ